MRVRGRGSGRARGGGAPPRGGGAARKMWAGCGRWLPLARAPPGSHLSWLWSWTYVERSGLVSVWRAGGGGGVRGVARRCVGLSPSRGGARCCLTARGLDLRVVALYAQQEETALFGAFAFEVVAEIDGFIVCLAVSQVPERNFAREALDQIVRTETAAERRIGKISIGLRNQMLQLIRQDAADVHSDARQVAYQGHDFSFAG